MQTQNIDVEYERYKDWDMSDSKPANLHPMVKKLQDNMRLAQSNQNTDLLDADVISWLVRQNSETKKRASELLRQAIAMQNGSFA